MKKTDRTEPIQITFGNIRISTDTRRVYVNDIEIELKNKEY
ncbi:hypothetical protein [Lacrimispora celerecrescens]|nr:hypothetical protein [Lacrimispora celerecrescens]